MSFFKYWRGVFSCSIGNRWLLRLRRQQTPALEPLGLVHRLALGPWSISVYHLPPPSEHAGRNARPRILGISGSWHDAAAVLLNGSELVATLEEERLSRIKHDGSQFPIKAINRLLEYMGWHWQDIDHVAIGWDYNWYVNTSTCRSLSSRMFQQMDQEYAKAKNIPLSQVKRRDVHERNQARYQPIAVQTFLDDMREHWQTAHRPQVSFVRHHLAHAASAYYPCGLPEPVLMVTLDGYGDGETTTVWLGHKGVLEPVYSLKLPHSLGWVYSSITEYLGFNPLGAEGEVMALAPYGVPQTPEETERVEQLRQFMIEYIHLDHENGVFRVNPEFCYFGNISTGKTRVTQKMLKRLAPLVPPSAKPSSAIDPNQPEDRPLANLAFVLQERMEEAVVHLARHFIRIHPRTRGIASLALAGGVAFNININARLIVEGLVAPQRLFVQPAAGDDGVALGAALLVAQEVYGLDPRFTMTRADYGPEYNDEEIRTALFACGLVEGKDFRVLPDDEAVASTVADLLADNRVVAWFQGRSEFGPRALGHRSILLNVTDPHSHAVANQIKQRQPWRPSAISVLAERAGEYVNVPGGKVSAPFMIVAYPVRPELYELIASGRHPLNGSTRLHTVNKNDNPLFWAMLHHLEALTGVPAVVNTSFNLREPLVESIFQAIHTISNMSASMALCIGRFLLNSLEPSDK